MTAYYKELQPADPYRIRLPYPFSNYDRQLLTLLYQPMIGAEAIALYLTLWAEGEASREETTHYTLMNTLGNPIAKIFDARIQLEAIGLLKTYRSNEGDRSFIYELCPPLDPKTFFMDPLLSMFLFSKIGESSYRRVRNRFLVYTEIPTDYEEVSRTFTDIFQPVHAKAGYPSVKKDLQERKKGNYEADSEFDFDLLRQGLSEQLVPKKVLTATIKDFITKLSYLYSWGPLEMQKVILLAIEDDYKLTVEGLKKSASEYYKLTVSTTAPQLVQVHKATEKQIDAVDTPKTKQDELLGYLETAPPIQVLRDIANGSEPLPADVELANQLVITHGMKPAVVNVLLQYVLLRTDMKLTKAYVEKIASHWLRKNVTTAKEAMEIARVEHTQYMKWKSEGSPTTVAKPFTGNGNRKPVREEKLPEWFHKKDQTPAPKVEPKNESLEVEKQKLLAKLALKKGKGG
ncbi:replication initiation and membrane attachment family protein [Planococcus donghaensis MPA1U2]|uniref:Replication initiation and membrane attachment family protein n=1 Tax=Planococcus donghaensis MPA1U2 TaxID=933115 RepID=E7RJW0_9BACL|nr:DnaD domain protein [Planococcus donghaensis]EGA88702.1 replication initiation and membrane attachment family protein [Planococcus donghaensis MPA1U2]